MSRTAKQAHRNLAMFIGLFVVIHFAAHAGAFLSIEDQASTMQWGRAVYQFPLIEIALVAALAAQIGLGIKLLRQISKRPRKDVWHKVQFVSACYLAYFITLHTIAAVSTRLIVGLDTNFYWTAGTLVLAPIKYLFAPYYILAVTALFSHLLAAMHFRKTSNWHVPALLIGPVIGALIVMAYSGVFYAVELPQTHADYFAAFLGVGE